MQEVIEKIIEQLKEWTFNADINIGDGTSMNHDLIESKNAIEIVKQAAEEYKSDQINQLAMMYAKNLVQYGVDVTKIWNTATQQTSSLNKAYMRGIQDERDRLEQNNNGWIPCSERLPDYKDTKDPFTKKHTYLTDYVNVTVKREKNGIDEYYVDTALMIGEKPDKMRWLQIEHLKNHEVVAWQPTPDPYNPKGE